MCFRYREWTRVLEAEEMKTGEARAYAPQVPVSEGSGQGKRRPSMEGKGRGKGEQPQSKGERGPPWDDRQEDRGPGKGEGLRNKGSTMGKQGVSMEGCFPCYLSLLPCTPSLAPPWMGP